MPCNMIKDFHYYTSSHIFHELASLFFYATRVSLGNVCKRPFGSSQVKMACSQTSKLFS